MARQLRFAQPEEKEAAEVKPQAWAEVVRAVRESEIEQTETRIRSRMLSDGPVFSRGELARLFGQTQSGRATRQNEPLADERARAAAAADLAALSTIARPEVRVPNFATAFGNLLDDVLSTRDPE
jgi:hypothetical protein